LENSLILFLPPPPLSPTEIPPPFGHRLFSDNTFFRNKYFFVSVTPSKECVRPPTLPNIHRFLLFLARSGFDATASLRESQPSQARPRSCHIPLPLPRFPPPLPPFSRLSLYSLAHKPPCIPSYLVRISTVLLLPFLPSVPPNSPSILPQKVRMPRRRPSFERKRIDALAGRENAWRFFPFFCATPHPYSSPFFIGQPRPTSETDRQYTLPKV